MAFYAILIKNCTSCDIIVIDQREVRGKARFNALKTEAAFTLGGPVGPGGITRKASPAKSTSRSTAACLIFALAVPSPE